MKKILFISLAVVLALSVGLIGCEGEGPVVPTVVKVGLARDTDGGPLAAFECGYGGTVYRWFANKVNDAGGVYLSDYDTNVDIELVVRDFDVLSWDLAAVTEALIDTDKVDFVWGGPATDCIFTQAPICNAAAKVLITLEGGASSMIWDEDIDSWPFVWVTLSFSNWNEIPVLHDMIQSQPEVSGCATAYVTYIGGPGSTHGIEYSTETKNVFGEANVIDGGFHDYEMDATACSAVITAAETAYNSTPYDIFCAYTYPWNVFGLTGALLGSTFDPPAILFGPGGNANLYPVLFGPYVEGAMSFIIADNYTSPDITALYAELATQAEADWADGSLLCDPGDMTSGWDALDYWGQPCYAAGLEMWLEAVEAAGNLDSVAVRNELAAFSESNPADTVLGDCWFEVFGVGGTGGGILSYDCHPAEIGQWQSGEYRSVGGNEPTASFNYPMTGSWFWLLD